VSARRLFPTLLGLALVGLLVVIRLADPTPVASVREIGFDSYQHLHPRAGGDSAVRVIDIDEASLAALGQWPWSRELLGTLTSRLGELGAAAIGFDMLFAEPDRLGPAQDEAFARALATTPSVLGFASAPSAAPMALPPRLGTAISGSDPKPSLPSLTGAVAPLGLLAEAAAGLGGLSLDVADSVGTVRRVPTLWSDGERLYPGLAIETLRLALGLDTIVALGDTAGGNTLDGLRVGPFTIPTAANGDIVVYDRVPDPTHTIPAAMLLGEGYLALRAEIEGRIVLVGTSASGLLDLHATPLSASRAGVLIHAGVIDQIVGGAYLSRADWVQGLEILVFIVVGVLLVFVVLRLGPLAGLFAGLAALGSLAVISYAGFVLRGWLIDATFPVAGALLVYGAMVYFQFSLAERSRREVRRAFGYYVAPELLAEIERNAGRLALGGELRELTVMFADMRGFTSFTEQHTPEETLATLNTLFGALGREIVERFGTIDKFIGDAIMAFWNAPVDVPEHPRRACEAALAMRARLDRLNEEGRFGPAGVSIGIGLSTGVALVGNMGLETRFDYSTIGDSVNVANRVEGESKLVGFDIVAAEPTRRAAPDFAWLEAGSVQLKGKAQRLAVHILVGDAALARSEAFRALQAAHAEVLAGGVSGPALARCAALGAAVNPRLTRFYELVPGRAEDFVSPA
jgi:adenylate cyclase